METAWITGASRGVGKGVASSLSRDSYRVFATGRSVAVAALPPEVVRIPCDHLRDEETAAAFECISNGGGSLEVLVNAAWGGYERMVENGAFTWSLPFWEQPGHRWSGMMDAGVRAAFVCASHAARRMLPNRRGLIVNISFWPAQKYIGNAIYGVSKAATDKLTSDNGSRAAAPQRGGRVALSRPGAHRGRAGGGRGRLAGFVEQREP